MPFILILPKQRRDTLDPARAAQRLCPYRGELRQIDWAEGQLHVSSLADLTPETVTIPSGTLKNPQTAWLEIRREGEGLRFETDPLGTFPLWLAEDEARLVITSEVKSLRALEGFELAFEPERWPASQKRPPDYSPYGNVRRVSPGAVLHVAPDRTISVEPRRPLDYHPCGLLVSAEDQKARLAATLEGSARAMGAADGPWGAFLSGGIDSSTAVALMKRQHGDLSTFTLGTEFGNEYGDAEELAAFVGTEHTRIAATDQEALDHFDRAVYCNETVDGLTAETLAQLSILATAAAGRVRRIVTGYGADLLFGSMLRHKLYMQVTGVDDVQSLIERTVWSGEFAPFFAWSVGVEIHHLFWDPEVMNCAFQIPPEASFDGTREKLVLRTLAVERGYMNEVHAMRKKQALTDGTQFNRLLSTAMKLTDRHAYEAKSARAVDALRRALAG